MAARPRPADFEGEFKAPSSDVPFTLHKTSSKRQRLSWTVRTTRCGGRIGVAVLGCAGADLTRNGFVRSKIEAGGAVRSFVSFESSISLFRWRLSAPAQQQAAIAGWGLGGAGSLRVMARADPTWIVVTREWREIAALNRTNLGGYSHRNWQGDTGLLRV